MQDDLTLHSSDDVQDYAAAVTPFLEEEPVVRNVLLTVIVQARSGWPAWTAPPRFWWITSGSVVVAAASWTPPFPLLISSMLADARRPIAAAAIGRARELGMPLPGVNGPRDAARALAETVAELSGQTVVERMRMLVHELAAIRDVPRPPGSARIAQPEDDPLVTEWMRAFNVEVAVAFGADIDATTRASVEAGRVWLWVNADEAVSTAAHHPAVGGVVRIGAVYTPPARRGRGYARCLVHDVSEAALATPGVRTCTLNTDASNPVSNAIYREIGYVPVTEHAEFSLVG